MPGPQAVVLAVAGRAIQRPPDCRALHEFDAKEMLSFRGAGIVVIFARSGRLGPLSALWQVCVGELLMR